MQIPLKCAHCEREVDKIIVMKIDQQTFDLCIYCAEDCEHSGEGVRVGTKERQA